MKCYRVPRLTVVEADGFVAGGRGDEVELGELHVAGNVDTPPCGPVVRNVLGGVAKLK